MGTARCRSSPQRDRGHNAPLHWAPACPTLAYALPCPGSPTHCRLPWCSPTARATGLHGPYDRPAIASVRPRGRRQAGGAVPLRAGSGHLRRWLAHHRHVLEGEHRPLARRPGLRREGRGVALLLMPPLPPPPPCRCRVSMRVGMGRAGSPPPRRQQPPAARRGGGAAAAGALASAGGAARLVLTPPP